MTLHWNHGHLPASPRAADPERSGPQPPDTLLDLVRDLRDADPANRWFFHWTDDSEHPGIDLWTGVTSAFFQKVGIRFPDLADRVGASPDNPLTRGKFREIEFRDEVAMASSELALAVAREPAPDYRTQLALAVWQLRHVVALVPESGRRGFLFQCWQHRTGELTPAQRTALCEHEPSTDGAGALPAMSPGAEHAWDVYLRALRRNERVWAAEEAPVNYLLFEHFHLTLRRLRIPPGVEALAARIVRAGLSPSGADRQPIAVPRSLLQTA